MGFSLGGSQRKYGLSGYILQRAQRLEAARVHHNPAVGAFSDLVFDLKGSVAEGEGFFLGAKEQLLPALLNLHFDLLGA